MLMSMSWEQGAWEGSPRGRSWQGPGHSLDGAALGAETPSLGTEGLWEPGVALGSAPSPHQLLSIPDTLPPGAPVPSPIPLTLLGAASSLLGARGQHCWAGTGDGADRDCVSGILYGTMTMELGGRVTIECEKNNFQAELEFKLKVAQAKAPSAPKGGVGTGEKWALATGKPPLHSRVVSGAYAHRGEDSSWHLHSTAWAQRGQGVPAGHTAQPGKAQTLSSCEAHRPGRPPASLSSSRGIGGAWPPPALGPVRASLPRPGA